MIVLGFDYGTAHVGIAKGDSEIRLVEPLKTLQNTPHIVGDIASIIELYKPHVLIVGVSEQRSALQAKKFAQTLSSLFPHIPVHTTDETLSTQDAAEKLSHLSSKKRQEREHSASAAVILENWLDAQGDNRV